MNRNKRSSVSSKIIILNLFFIIISLTIYYCIKGTFSYLIIVFLPLYALLNGLFVYLIYWYDDIFYKREAFYYQINKIPNQNYLKTLNKNKFKGDNFVLVSIIINNHEELIKVFSELFFYEILNSLFDKLKEKIDCKNIIVSNNIRKIMIILETEICLNKLNVIEEIFNDEFLVEKIPIKLEYSLGYETVNNLNNLGDSDLFLKADIASTYAFNHNLKVVSFHEIKDRYQYDYSLLENIPDAIKNNELYFVYQPIIPVEKESFLYLEMLIRWKRDDVLIMPNDFIPYLEESLLINDVTLYAIKIAIEKINEYLRQNIKVAISINVSVKNLENEKFVKEAIKLINNSKLDPNHFEFEITEGFALNFTDKLLKNINKLSELGINLTIDDFGAGFTGISHFNKLPLNYVKLDKDLSRDINNKESTNALLINLIKLLKDLGYKVVCEGVERLEQQEFLIKNGIDYLQGYYISKPLSDNDVHKWILENYNKFVKK